MNVDKNSKIIGSINAFEDSSNDLNESNNENGQDNQNVQNTQNTQLQMDFDEGKIVDSHEEHEEVKKDENSENQPEQLKLDIPSDSKAEEDSTESNQPKIIDKSVEQNNDEQNTDENTDEKTDEEEKQSVCGNCLRPIPSKSVFCPYCGQRDPLNTKIIRKVIVVRNNRIRKVGDRYILLENDNQRNGVLIIDGYYKGKDFNFIFMDDASKFKCGVYLRKDNRIIQLTETTEFYLECYYECNQVVNDNYEYVNLIDVDDSQFIDDTPIEEEKKKITDKIKDYIGLKSSENKLDKVDNSKDNISILPKDTNENNEVTETDNAVELKAKLESVESGDTDKSDENIEEIVSEDSKEPVVEESSAEMVEETQEPKVEDSADDDYEPISSHFKTNDTDKEKKSPDKNSLFINRRSILLFIGAIVLVFLLVVVAISCLPRDSKVNENYEKTAQVAKATNEELPTIIEKAQKKTVSVTVYRFGQSVSSGSGVVYKVDNKDVYIVTNAHVTSSGTQYKVTFYDGEEVEAELVNYSTKSDISVLKCSVDFEVEAYEMGDSSVLKAGETAIAIGSPLSVENAGTVTKGIISAVSRELTVDADGDGIVDTKRNAIQTDAAINPGNSGGALINASGQLIGITNMKLASSDIEGIGYAIPVNDVVTIADKIINSQNSQNSKNNKNSRTQKNAGIDESDENNESEEDIVGTIGNLKIVR